MSPEAPKYEDVGQVPVDVEEYLEVVPEDFKEPARESLRFIVFLVATGVVLVLGLFGDQLPILDEIPTSSLIAAGWQVVALVLGYIASRTYRPGKVPSVTTAEKKVVVKKY